MLTELHFLPFQNRRKANRLVFLFKEVERLVPALQSIRDNESRLYFKLNHSADVFLFPLESLSTSCYFENEYYLSQCQRWGVGVVEGRI